MSWRVLAVSYPANVHFGEADTNVGTLASVYQRPRKPPPKRRTFIQRLEWWVLGVRAAMAGRPRDSWRVGNSGVLMRILNDAVPNGGGIHEDWLTEVIEADESGSILQSRICTY
jgi:hypothetical protein